MGNTLERVVNFNEYKAYTCINEDDILSDTQSRLKEEDDKLLLEITKISAKCDFNNIGSTRPICEAIREHKKKDWITFSNIENEVNMKEYVNETLFIESIKSNEDFIRAYIVEEEKNNIWILIQESTFEYNKKYLEYKNKFQLQNSEADFNITIFDEDELEDLEEELSYKENYKRIY